MWDGGTKADAHASGLDGGRGDDTIQNTAEVDATANSTTSSHSVAMTVAGVSGAFSTATSTAAAAAIDAGEGDDPSSERRCAVEHCPPELRVSALSSLVLAGPSPAMLSGMAGLTPRQMRPVSRWGGNVRSPT